MDDTELLEAVRLLAPEFPDAPRAHLEAVLRECQCDIPAARRRLLEEDQQRQAAQRASQQGRPMQAAEPAGSAEDDGGWSWASFNQGMRDLGLEQLGAQLSLLGRQITTSINAMLPEELALFGYDEEELEEEEARAAAKAAHEAAVERETAAVVATGTKLQARRHAGPHAARAQRGTEDEEEEWQDDDKLN